MGFEVDFLPVGDESKGGDAIALRYGNLNGSRNDFKVAIIDGGFAETGGEIVEHIKEFYGTSKVDTVVSTHPDNDHLGGLATVLEKMVVGELWMHLPWNHTKDVACIFKDGRVTDNSVREDLRESLDAACALERLARKKNIPIREPFTGVCDLDGSLCVVGPTLEFYESLLPGFQGTPEPRESRALGILARVAAKADEVIKRVLENWNFETLTDDGETSAENNTSVILLLRSDEKNLLFTADAGIPALTKAADILDTSGYDYTKYSFVQVPHHGSQRNVGPTILNRLLGPKLKEPEKQKSSFASVPKEGEPKHPAKKVTNAFLRRGAPVHVTGGAKKWHYLGAPDRGWSQSIPLPLYTEVEE
ncbi:MAG: MBL fold hydrolase [Deltaproteobacteria bacterium HGW-Deltaproteobacteria-21]|nr:MAG: MBL fold hydrolase [Deltaproteobacteria bacterium HGW-Deltaproteobacteria-21]